MIKSNQQGLTEISTLTLGNLVHLHEHYSRLDIELCLLAMTLQLWSNFLRSLEENLGIWGFHLVMCIL